MKQRLLLLFFSCCYCSLLSQPVFHINELKKAVNPYESALPKNFNYPFSVEKSSSRDVVFKPAVELYDYYNGIISDWQPSFKFEYNYNAATSLNTLNEFNYDPAAFNWINTRRTSIEYDGFGFQSKATEETYDITSGELNEYALYEYQHEPDGNLMQEKTNYWNTLSADWLANHKHDYTYDSNDREISVTHADWLVNEMQWNSYEHYFSLYDASGNIVRYWGQLWDADAALWLNETKDTMYYDSFNQRIHSETQLWSLANSTWYPYYGNDYEYDGMGNMIRITGMLWDSAIMQFRNTNQYLYEFDNYKLEETIFQLWDDPSAAWINFNKIHFDYDTSGFLIQKIISNWNGSDWNESYQYIFTNDENGNVLQSVGQTWNGSAGAWSNIERYTATWVSMVTSVAVTEAGEKELFLYPNPASDRVFISGMEKTESYSVEIADFTGKLLLSFPKLAGEYLDLSDLPEGIYILCIKENSRNISAAQKLVVTK